MFIFFFKYVFICFWLSRVFVAALGLSLAAVGGSDSPAVAREFLSLCPPALEFTGSAAVALGFFVCGYVALVAPRHGVF